MDETCPENTQKKRKKESISFETSSTVAENTNCTSTQNTAGSKKKKKHKKKKNQKPKLPIISDERLKAYGINPKKFKYFHQKKLLQEQR